MPLQLAARHADVSVMSVASSLAPYTPAWPSIRLIQLAEWPLLVISSSAGCGGPRLGLWTNAVCLADYSAPMIAQIRAIFR